MSFRDRLPIFYVATASLYAVAGMFVGLYQHLSHDKKPIPFHSHLDSLGWLSLAVIGIVMQVMPWAREHRLAVVLFLLLEAGCLLMLGGLPLVYLNMTRIPIEIGAVLVPVGFVLFSLIMFTGLVRQK